MGGNVYCKAADCLRQIENLTRLCGIFPYRSSSDSTISKFNLIYSLLFIPLTALSLLRGLVVDVGYSEDIVCFTFILSSLVTFLFHFTASVVPLFMGKTYSKLFNRLERTEILVHKLNISQERCTTISFNMLVVVYSTTLVYHVYVAFFIIEIPASETVGFVAIFITFLVCLFHLLTLLRIVKRKLVSVNWHLHYLNNTVPVYLSPADAKIFILNKIYGKDVSEKFVSYAADTRRVTARKIKTFNQIHFLLYSSCNLIAKYFSLQILFSVLLTVLKAITVVISIWHIDISNTPVHVAIATLCVQNFILVFCIANVFYKIQCESTRTEDLVYDLLDVDHPDDVVNQLQTFAKQMISRKLQFSAYGFFDVDLKMITSMVGLGLPVTLFLVQYSNRAKL